MKGHPFVQLNTHSSDTLNINKQFSKIINIIIKIKFIIFIYNLSSKLLIRSNARIRQHEHLILSIIENCFLYMIQFNVSYLFHFLRKSIIK